MKTKKTTNSRVKIKDLVPEVLKIDPAALASLGAKSGASGDRIEAGLHEFMRQWLERSLGLLWAPDDCTLRLHSDAAARALEYQDARIHNLLQLCTMAVLREPRRRRGLKDLLLGRADAKIVDLPRKPDGSEPRSTFAELAAMAAVLFEPDFDAIRDAPAPEASSVSMCGLMADLLKVAPETLIRPYYDSQREAADRFARDPEGQSVAGLSALLTRVFHDYPTIVDQKIDSIRFLYSTDANYQGLDGPTAANLAALLTAAALADGNRDLGFVAV